MKKATFRLARGAHGSRNQMESWEEQELQERAKKAREVLLPGVDIATAWAMQQLIVAGPEERVLVHAKRLGHGVHRPDPISMKQLSEELSHAESLQLESDLWLAESGFAVFMHEGWPGLHHVVRYFDLIEKNEAPDTSLLEWLVSAGAVPGQRALETVERFAKKVTVGRHGFVLDPDDAMRLKLAAEVRAQLEAEARASSA